jgi:hypothetical protein
MTIIGHRTSFQEDINVIIPTVTIAGRELGHNILNKIENSLQPSIRAASIRSTGMLLKYWLNIIIDNPFRK